MKPDIKPLTDAQRRHGLAAVEAARQLQQELLAKRGGVPFSASSDIINQQRDERSRQLG